MRDQPDALDAADALQPRLEPAGIYLVDAADPVTTLIEAAAQHPAAGYGAVEVRRVTPL